MGSQGGTGKFYTQKIVSSTKVGRDGRPVNESYQSKAQGVYGRGSKPEIVERKQMYQNTGTGLEKAAHERMYQGKGRKVVYENDRASGSSNSYNYYKNISESDAHDFDRQWDHASKQLGLSSDTKSLPYGSGAVRNYRKSNTQNYYDDASRGVYVDNRLREPDMPVNYRANPTGHIDRLYPTDTSNRMDVPRPRADAPTGALAIGNGDNRRPNNRQAYNVNANTSAPLSRGKQARIG